MISEKMIEYLILSDILNRLAVTDDVTYRAYDDKYDLSKMQKRYKTLQDEFLSPYVISKAGN